MVKNQLYIFTQPQKSSELTDVIMIKIELFMILLVQKPDRMGEGLGQHYRCFERQFWTE